MSTLTFSSDSMLLAIAHGDRPVRLWDLGEMREWRTVSVGSTVSAVAFSPGGRRLATAGDEVRLWEVRSGRLLTAPFPNPSRDRSVRCLAFGGEGMTLAFGGCDAGAQAGFLRIWNPCDGPGGRPIGERLPPVTATFLSRDGKTLLSTGSDRVLRLWNVSTGVDFDRFTSIGGIAIAMNPERTLLASAGQDGAIHLWDVRVRRPVRTLRGRSRDVSALSFVSNGDLLVSGGDDGILRLWDIGRGIEIDPLDTGLGPIADVAASPDGGIVAAIGREGHVYLWSMEPAPEPARGAVATTFELAAWQHP